MPWGGQTMITIWFLSSVSSDPNAPAAQYMNRRWEDRPNEYVFRRLVYDNGGQIVQSDTGTAYGIVESYKRQIQLALRYGQTKFGGNIVDGTIDTLWYKRPADHDKKLIDELRFAKEYKRTEEYMAIANLPPHQDEASFKFIKNAMGKDEFDAEIMSKTSNGDAEAGISHALNVESVGILKERMRARANDPGFAKVLEQFNYTYSGLGTLWKDTRVHILVLHDPANGGKDSDPILMTLCPMMTATDLQKQEIQRKRSIQNARSLCHPLDGINVLLTSGARLPPTAGTNDQFAAQLILGHLVDFLHTYQEWAHQGVIFHLVFESNLSQSKVGAICKFMHDAAKAAHGTYKGQMGLDYTAAMGYDNDEVFRRLPANFFDMIRVYHDFDKVIKSINVEQTVFPSAHSAQDLQTAVFRAYGASDYDLSGMYTTHETKNEGFTTLDMALIKGNVAIHPRFITLSSVETADEFLEFFTKQMCDCMKVISKKSTSIGAHGFKYGKAVKKGCKDDAVTLLALAFSVIRRMKIALLIAH